MSALHTTVTVHHAEVLSVQQVQQGSDRHTVIVELGRRLEELPGSAVTLFMSASELLPFVVGLVNGAESASPGFLLELLDELTG